MRREEKQYSMFSVNMTQVKPECDILAQFFDFLRKEKHLQNRILIFETQKRNNEQDVSDCMNSLIE